MTVISPIEKDSPFALEKYRLFMLHSRWKLKMKINNWQFPPETENNSREDSIHDRRHECHMRTLSIAQRSIVDRLNAYFSCIQNSSSVHLTSRFRLSIESKRLVVFTIYANFFPAVRSALFFFFCPCLPYGVQAKSCQKQLRGRFEKHMLADIFAEFYPRRSFPLIPRASNHLYVNST